MNPVDILRSKLKKMNPVPVYNYVSNSSSNESSSIQKTQKASSSQFKKEMGQPNQMNEESLLNRSAEFAMSISDNVSRVFVPKSGETLYTMYEFTA